ncbi:MAG: hypothetical protein AAB797_00880 [Patescibacteria group bacterium]
MKGAKSKFIIALFSFLLLAVGFLWFKDFVSAQTTSPPDLGLTEVGSAIGLPATDIRVVVANIIRTALGLLGIVALVLILYAGYLWMTAGGEDDKISQAKKILFNAVIGLAIILSSYAIASFVISKLVDATTGTGGIAGPGGGGGNPYFPAGIFYVDSLPSGGQLCIRNVHLAVTFNREVDVATLNGNVVVQNAAGAEHAGQWQLLSNTTAAFVPNGDCGGGTPDCYTASTTYTLHFNNASAVRTSDGQMSLNCLVRAGCGDVQFTTGNGVDRLPPQVKIEPIASDLLRVGSVVPVVVSYTDDNGVQKIDLTADNYFVGSQTIAGCQRTGAVTLNWPTVGIASGQHTLGATGFDWSALSYNTSTNVNLLPQHCFDNVLQADLGEVQAGPPACGGECGACAGTPCSSNTQCASGYCDPVAGVCVDRMRVNGVSPLSGGPGTLVSVAGNYFGSTPGQVFIGAALAPLADCGIGAWRPWQIIIEVPVGAVSGPVRVETAPDVGGNRFIDATNDSFGPMISDFTVNGVVRPGLCSISPVSALPGAEILLIGRRLGIAPGQVFFGQQNVPVSLSNWTDTLVRARVPLLDAAPVGVKVSQNNLDSNSLRFFIEQGLSGTAPFISNITPDRGARGEYITITGNNFGDQTGIVWFKLNEGGLPGEAIAGDFTFPTGCQNTWTDKQIIVKFPAGSGLVGRSYFVQVRPADAGQGQSPIGPIFNLESGAPAPGICNINPVSGPVPFPAIAPAMQIIGENFGSSPAVYFWSASASATSTAGRVLANTTGVANLSVGQAISTRPLPGTATGPVVVSRTSDNKLSNPQNFSVLDCVKNNNTCPTAGTHCCAAGPESGWCKPAGELCEGQTLSAGFIWRFSTKDIPKIPRVVERCDSNTDLGLNIPTPSPSAGWDTSTSGPHHNVCRTAAVMVEFSLPNINNISRANLLINECQAGTVDEARRTCGVAQMVDISGTGDLVPQLSTESTSYLQLNPDISYNNGRWKDNTWYQVLLGSGISAGTGTSTAPLAMDMPCGGNSAYCFVFKADAQDCRMRRVVITPYSYWTSILEAPIKHRDFPQDAGADVIYTGHGLSTQHCIIMDTSAFNWSWGAKNTYYADIFSSNNSSAKVSALANTVGVGLTNPDNAVNITATATLASVNYAGQSPLTVDLNNPEVVDFWPTCLESCANAEVGARFNTTMSNRNLPGSAVSGPVKLLKCNDENCFNTTPVLVSADVSLDSANEYRILRIANSGAGSVELEPNTIYKVILSASTTNVNSAELLWSAARLGDPTTYSKPYNKQFSWRFKTKKERCKIGRVDVVPQNFIAEFINDKEIYNAQPYSSPDTCSAQGQKLNPWTVSWNWNSSLPNVAGVTTFSTRGNNPYCTLGCTRKGSSIPVSFTAGVPVCGNGIVEAGEDCDSPLKGAGCGLDCRRLGNNSSSTCGNGIIEPNLGETCDSGLATSAVGCDNTCLHSGSAQATDATATGASICGNGFIGSGEDCDLGIGASATVAISAMGCSENCLHRGARLSNNWCYTNNVTYGGFTQREFESACRNAISRCGDGINNPDEDAGCDLGGGAKASWCNDFCLINFPNPPNECVLGAEGCDANRQHLGSSLLYSAPSLCGDGMVGIGEDNFCETNLPNTHTGINPWSLATGVGLGIAAGIPPTQQTDINANTTEQTVGGAVGDKGQFTIPCGYKTDAECQTRMGNNWGVAANGCCYLRPKLLNVYPGNTSTVAANVCPNTAIEASFDQEIDLTSLKNNIILARGIGSASTCVGTEDVTSLAVSAESSNQNNLPWYKKIFVAVVSFFKNLVGEDATATHTVIQSVKWCAGEDAGRADVLIITSTLSKIIFKLNKPLAFDADYFVALKDGIRSKQGVSIGQNNSTNKPWSWKFITGSQICEIDSAVVEPAQVYLNRVGATSTLVANAYNVNTARIQPIPGYYSWEYLWQPAVNPYVNLSATTSSLNTISAQNRSGEIDVRASAIITANIYSAQFGSVATGKSHVIVFLCENPWPPKDLYLGGAGPYIIFPYEDKVGNNDGYDLAADTFNNTAIPPSPSGGYFNFRSYYCADNGSYGIADDLPYLRPAVQVSSAIVSDSPTSSLKRFIFTSATNNDAIGMQVFSNPKHLTVSQWFANDRALGGQGFVGNMQTTKIDGYDALTDGNNIYVDALNYSDASNNLYSNIYLFSINANAQASTKKVFEQIIGNLRFNTNLTNYGYCGATMANPGASTTCQSDLDCSDVEVCSVQIDKLKRNYRRLRDLNEIQNLLGP